MASFSFDSGIFSLPDGVPAIHGGHGDGQGIVHLVDNLLATITQQQPSSWHLFGGIESLGANIHPLILHFPIAFLLGFFFLEVYGLLLHKAGIRRFASGLLNIGAFCSVFTVISGLIAAGIVPHSIEVHGIMEWHERAGITVTVIAITLALWRGFGGIPQSSMSITLNLMLSLLMAGLLFVGGDLGGQMVYQYGVAVKNLQPESSTFHHQHTTPPSGQP